MKQSAYVLAIAFSAVGLSVILGFSEEAGLFGAIVGVGSYAAQVKGGA